MKSIHTSLKLLAISIAILSSGAALANQPIEVIDINRVDPIVIDDAKSNYSLEMQAKTLKSNYAVNEPIRFVVKPNQNAYVYILSNEKSGKTLLIYPNKIDKNNFIVANSTQTVPSINSSKSTLFADKVGTETFSIIASKTPLDLNTLSMVNRGDYMTTSSDDMSRVLASYGIRIGDVDGNLDRSEVAVKQVQVKVSSNAVVVDQPNYGAAKKLYSMASTTSYGSTLMLSTDNQNYRTGNPVTITYGATGRNYLNLAVRLNNGTLKTLKSIKNRGQINQAQFFANPNVTDVMLWESDKKVSNKLPRAENSVILDLKIR